MMKIATIIVRTLFGLLLLFASTSYFFELAPQPELSGNVKIFMEGVLATGYMMTLIKLIELVCGLAFVTGYFVSLATVLMAPITVNIFLFHLFLDNTNFPVALFVLASNLFLAYAHRTVFAPVLRPK